MDLINQIMHQQIVPEGPTACHQNIFKPYAFLIGNSMYGSSQSLRMK
jgi:hypothetical protein